MDIGNGRYRLIRRLGVGGTGSVYQAADLTLGRTVAIKALHDSAADGLLLEEGASLARLSHPNVVTLYDLVVEGGRPYLVLECVDGCDLERWIAERGPLKLEQALDIIRRVALAVLAAHARGLLHCDLKPGNVLLSTSGEVKLTDFTLARHRSGTGFLGPLGASTAYAAPEQLSGGEVSPRTDVYGLGALLQRILDREDLASAEGQQVQHAIDRAMMPDPAERFGDVGEFLRALPACDLDTQLVARSQVSDLTRVAPGSRPERFERARSAWWAPVALCCALLLASFATLSHFTVHAQPARTTVPDLIGADRASAQLVVRSLGLHPHLLQAYSSAVPAGVISSQEPRPGSAVGEAASVTLVVSKGPAPVAVPDVHDLSQTAAVAALRARGFRVAVSTSDTIFKPEGVVLDQSPLPGAERVPGTTITITVSTKPWWWIF